MLQQTKGIISAPSPPPRSGEAALVPWVPTRHFASPPRWAGSPIHFSLHLPWAYNPKLLRSLRLLELCSWANLTSRAPDGTRTWLDLPVLLPDLLLSPFPPVPQPWPGDRASTRPGQFWRLSRGPGDWAWGGIHQIIASLPEENVLTLQRWTEGRGRSLTRSGHTFTTSPADFTNRCSHRLLVHPSCSPGKGIIRAEFPDTPQLTPAPGPIWVDALHPLDSSISWSIYTDASWRAVHPPQAQAVFGLRGSHHGRGALFFTADHPDWCSEVLAVHFEIPRLSLPSGARHRSLNFWRFRQRFRQASVSSTHSIYGAPSTRTALERSRKSLDAGLRAALFRTRGRP